MALTPGTRIGPYEIAERIGVGGMGEVYRAADTRLGRDVAVKVLPDSFARDAERLARLDREARTLASLNHPNIAAIYGLEDTNGSKALVMELVEGPTLADRIAGGAIPVDEALPIARQIAEALEAAHERGIVHRDLKPANVKARPDGTVKVLDFGLAKALDPTAATSPSQSMSPTITTPAMTQAGLILGTAAYMSPEQARGRPADRRSDVWALGCVLYEMLAGRPAFGGADVATILARVVDRPPDFGALPANLHHKIAAVLDRCLQKEAARRYHDVADLRLDLETAAADPAGLIIEPVTAGRSNRSTLPWIATLVLAAIVAAFTAWMLKPETAPERGLVRRWAYDVPQEIAVLGPVLLDIAPNDEYFVFSAGRGGAGLGPGLGLYVRYMNELHARLIPGSEGAGLQPAVSPDGREIAFGMSPAPRKIAVGGGQPTRLTTEAMPRHAGMSWDSDGLLHALPAGIFRLPSAGGSPELVIEAEAAEAFFGPRRLPDGNILFTVAPGGDWSRARIAVQAPGAGADRSIVVRQGIDARYLPTGHLIYAWAGNLYGVAFDLDTLETTGSPVLLEQGLIAPEAGGANYAVSRRGMLVYVTGSSGSASLPETLVWVDREGAEAALGLSPRTYRMPRLNPDGTRVAFVIGGPDSSKVWVSDLTRSPPSLSRLTDEGDPGNETSPLWTVDGERIVFASSREGDTSGGLFARPRLFSRSADGTGPVEPLNVRAPEDAILFSPRGWSAEGLLVLDVLRRAEPNPRPDIAVVSIETGVWTSLVQSDAKRSPAISPRGDSIAYVSDRDGSFNVYVERFPDGGGRVPITTDGGQSPLWSADGSELFYRRLSDGAIMVVAVEGGERFGRARVLIDGGYHTAPWGQYDYDAERQRFLMVKPAEGNAPAARDRLGADGVPGTDETGAANQRIIVVQNWFEYLEEQIQAR